MGRPKKNREQKVFGRIPPKKKPKLFGKAARKKLVKIGEELHILTADDISYIKDLTHTEAQVRTRYTTARQR